MQTSMSTPCTRIDDDSKAVQLHAPALRTWAAAGPNAAVQTCPLLLDAKQADVTWCYSKLDGFGQSDGVASLRALATLCPGQIRIRPEGSRLELPHRQLKPAHRASQRHPKRIRADPSAHLLGAS